MATRLCVPVSSTPAADRREPPALRDSSLSRCASLLSPRPKTESQWNGSPNPD